MPDWLAHFLANKGEVIVAGLAGAAVSATMEWTGWPSALRRIFVGTVCATWLSPLGVPMLKFALNGLSVPTENAIGMSGFLVGVLGIVLIEFLLKLFRMRLQDQTKGGE